MTSLLSLLGQEEVWTKCMHMYVVFLCVPTDTVAYVTTMCCTCAALMSTGQPRRPRPSRRVSLHRRSAASITDSTIRSTSGSTSTLTSLDGLALRSKPCEDSLLWVIIIQGNVRCLFISTILVGVAYISF